MYHLINNQALKLIWKEYTKFQKSFLQQDSSYMNVECLMSLCMILSPNMFLKELYDVVCNGLIN